MKHCIIRHRHFKSVMSEIMALSQAGFKARWSCKKDNGVWKATSTTPIAYSLDELQRAVA